MSQETPFISFPPGFIADEPVRVPILLNEPEFCAFDKPAGIAAFQDSRIGGGPRALLPAIRDRAAKGAAQFVECGLQTPYPVNLLDREVSGVLLCAKTAEAKAFLKNAMGSDGFTFRYRFLAEGEEGESELECDLPLAVHRSEYRALVTHSAGKKTATRFRRLENFGAVSLWESESVFDRFHQVRLHAAESGLRMLGETIYLGKKQFGGGVSGGKSGDLALHLGRLEIRLPDREVAVEAPEPTKIRDRISRLRSR